ncbi:hypothetical protein ACH4S8_18070 [Streptomyces sp. NPDC021080]|uniref:hypothetical protein n=1 Tax=Streptomyces sp. NPDC021080 TaxID=3365110 RepID=UPI00379E06B1
MRAVGKGTASIGWGGGRPDDAEAERPGVATYDGVEVVFNGDGVTLSQSAERTRPAASRVSRTPGRS